MKVKLYIILLILLFFQKPLVKTLVHDGLTKALLGSYTSSRTVNLLNQLCNDSQEDDVISRDACYGCFYRASNKATGYPMLLSMSACADLYLTDSKYGHCQVYLQTATSNAETRSSPSTIYCTFIECVRQANKDTLGALMALDHKMTSRQFERQKSYILILQSSNFRVVRLRYICYIRNDRNPNFPILVSDIDPRWSRG